MLGKELFEWQRLSGLATAKEISQQPTTWRKTLAQIRKEKEAIAAFVAPFVSGEDVDIIFSGGGTSEYAGNAAYSYVNRYTHFHAKSYASTDIVQTPENYLSRNKKTLLIHYGRSGNSPESVGTIEVADTVCKENVYHLIITCNKDGLLSTIGRAHKRAYVIDLPPETCDESFVMTSSYTNMLLASILCFRLDELDVMEKQMESIIQQSQRFLDLGYPQVEKWIKDFDFKRIVYLGANTLKGTAQEAQLKMCELTQGQVTTNFDSPMGFRHGPKSVINDQTLVVLLLSDDPYQKQYDADIIREIGTQRKKDCFIVLAGHDDEVLKTYTNQWISFDFDTGKDNILLGLAYILFAQILALYKSIDCGYAPDNPCPSGEVNRVVQGVTIYPYERK